MKNYAVMLAPCMFILLSSVIYAMQTSPTPVAPRDLENLGIIDSTVRKSTLDNKLNLCNTTAGRDYFQQSLRNPCCDTDILTQRQTNLKLLIDNPEATFEMKHFLKQCGKLEDALQLCDSHQDTLDEFYFKQKQLAKFNCSTTALNTSLVSETKCIICDKK